MARPTKAPFAPDMKIPSTRRGASRPITEAELDAALLELSSGMAPGVDEVRFEELKQIGGATKKCVLRPFSCSMASRLPAMLTSTEKITKVNSVKEPRLANKRPDFFLQTPRKATQKKMTTNDRAGKAKGRQRITSWKRCCATARHARTTTSISHRLRTVWATIFAKSSKRNKRNG
ncbi:hypothetical protein TRVL_07192 [Trypanosoma vivax]|nr:hypothetical protein TRVL_07192 [Trypanosoma vivax]